MTASRKRPLRVSYKNMFAKHGEGAEGMFNLLLVDDEASVVDTLAVTIPWADLEIESVFKAYSGDAAIEIMKSNHVDLVITDIHMPGLSGLEFVRYINAHMKKTKYIILSGHADFQYAREALSSDVSEYLVKPVGDDELIQAVRRVIREIKQEWERVSSYQKAVYTLKENVSLLSGTLLNDLLQGRRSPAKELEGKLAMLEMPFASGDFVSLLAIRVEDGFPSYANRESSLLEYSIRNILEELFAEHFDVWHTKDVHEYLVTLVKPKTGPGGSTVSGPDPAWNHQLSNAATQLQNSVHFYLKGRISIVQGRFGSFPGDVVRLYQAALSEFRTRIGMDSGLFLTVPDQAEPAQVRILHRLHEPPLLVHLLEAGQWDSAERKLREIMEELEERPVEAAEYLSQVFYAVAGAFTYISHKNGTLLEDLIGPENSVVLGGPGFQSVEPLRNWTLMTLGKLRDSIDSEMKSTRVSIVRQARDYIEQNLSQDVSLRAVADHVYLHPNYLSKIYKLEFGEGISETIFRLRMEKSLHMLKHGGDKVYEIAEKLGYQSPHYFIKVFKKHFGLTPQEYRSKLIKESAD